MAVAAVAHETVIEVQFGDALCHRVASDDIPLAVHVVNHQLVIREAARLSAIQEPGTGGQS